MTDVPAGSRVSSGDARPELVVEAVNGLTVVTPARPRDGDVTAALTFRVGVADEPLAMRGICHLIEHLGLSNFQSDRLRWNGSVDLSRTTFLAEGPAAEVTRFLREVTSALGSLPESRIGHERRILQVEAQSRAGSIFESLLAMRYGLRGPGIVIAPEWVKGHFPGTCSRQFTAENNGTKVAFFEYEYDSDPQDSTIDSVIVYVIRRGNRVRIEHDMHLTGLFSVAEWRGLFKRSGFALRQVDTRHAGEPRQPYLLVGRQNGSRD